MSKQVLHFCDACGQSQNDVDLTAVPLHHRFEFLVICHTCFDEAAAAINAKRQQRTRSKQEVEA